MLRSVGMAMALLAILAVPANGQIEIAIGPLAGAYVPTGEVADNIRVGTASFFNVSQDPGPAFGGRLGVRVAMFGVEAEGIYALSSLDLPDRAATDDAEVLLASLNIMYNVFQAPFSPLVLWLSGGAGLVSHQGDVYDNFQDTSDPAGVIGIGGRFGIGPLANLRFDLRDYIYAFKPTRGTTDRDSKIQNDLMLTVGFEFTFSPIPSTPLP